MNCNAPSIRQKLAFVLGWLSENPNIEPLSITVESTGKTYLELQETDLNKFVGSYLPTRACLQGPMIRCEWEFERQVIVGNIPATRAPINLVLLAHRPDLAVS